ncbi:unnamed protein product [Closterium sp. NIES-53]
MSPMGTPCQPTESTLSRNSRGVAELPDGSTWLSVVARHAGELQSIQQQLQRSDVARGLHVLRVNQMDALRLDDEMRLMLKEQLMRVVALVPAAWVARGEAELELLLDVLVWRFSLWADRPLPGCALMNLRFRDERTPRAGAGAAAPPAVPVRTGVEGPGLTVGQKVLWLVLTGGVKYVWARLHSTHWLLPVHAHMPHNAYARHGSGSEALQRQQVPKSPDSSLPYSLLWSSLCCMVVSCLRHVCAGIMASLAVATAASGRGCSETGVTAQPRRLSSFRQVFPLPLFSSSSLAFNSFCFPVPHATGEAAGDKGGVRQATHGARCTLILSLIPATDFSLPFALSVSAGAAAAGASPDQRVGNQAYLFLPFPPPVVIVPYRWRWVPFKGDLSRGGQSCPPHFQQIHIIPYLRQCFRAASARRLPAPLQRAHSPPCGDCSAPRGCARAAWRGDGQADRRKIVACRAAESGDVVPADWVDTAGTHKRPRQVFYSKKVRHGPFNGDKAGGEWGAEGGGGGMGEKFLFQAGEQMELLELPEGTRVVYPGLCKDGESNPNKPCACCPPILPLPSPSIVSSPFLHFQLLALPSLPHSVSLPRTHVCARPCVHTGLDTQQMRAMVRHAMDNLVGQPSLKERLQQIKQANPNPKVRCCSCCAATIATASLFPTPFSA